MNAAAQVARRTQGLTLIELLIGLSLALIVLTAAFNLFISSSQTASELQIRNDLRSEMQIAQNYLAAQVREAVYVFPRGTALQLGSGYTTKRPGLGTWRVGDDAAPVLAFIRPPESAGAACTNSNKDGCYAFYAYYPVLRSGWVSNAMGANNPGQDGQNQDRWLLVEYRANFVPPTTLTAAEKKAFRPSLSAINLASPYNPPASGQGGRLLLDYVRPAALAPAGAPPLFTQQDAPTPATLQTPGAVSVSINLTSSRRIRGKVLQIPGQDAASLPADTVQTITVFPRNLGSLAP
ncbi:PilW family protein [Deinococcus oregonensis]|uniref:PilW family protein n=1 Tax=Deinococcus oregonensis TaxID=1805970 RepID=A0ABV6B3T6_9DEIO